MSPVVALGVLALGLLATARITRLVTTDRIGLPLRLAVLRRWPAPPDDPDGLSLPGYLVHCRWCVSVWIAVPAAFLVSLLLVDGWDVVALGSALALAYSHLTGLLVALEPED